jgi:hypothetical protein
VQSRHARHSHWSPLLQPNYQQLGHTTELAERTLNMSLDTKKYDPDRLRRKPVFTVKPFTHAELIARAAAESYLALARNYLSHGDTLNTVSCCIEALILIDGVTRPLAVRDQIIDLVRAIDPGDDISSKIRNCMYAGRSAITSWATSPDCKYLERLISAHQLMDYPSDDKRFNEAYENARWQLRKGYNLRELYVIEYRSGLGSPLNDRYFAPVPAAMISRRGPHYLTDICAAVRQ